jgi:phosphoribosylformylglycinamidine synthase
MVKTAVLFTAGTNCDEETIQAFHSAGAKAERVHLNFLKKKKHLLKEYQILVIPGGFTYGDYISAGKILANELKYILEESVNEFINQGKLIIGICNGFQVLVKAGILPGLTKSLATEALRTRRIKDKISVNSVSPWHSSFFSKQTVTLDTNDSNRFECRWIFLKPNPKSPCIFTRGMNKVISIPVAHAEGKFITDNNKTLQNIKENNQIVFTYCDENGKKAKYPYNPNGSVAEIAGICDASGRIFGLMPHPERASSIYQYPNWHTLKGKFEPDGLKVFVNAVNYAKENL